MDLYYHVTTKYMLLHGGIYVENNNEIKYVEVSCRDLI